MIENVNAKTFEENNSGLIVVDFYATWCGPCKMISPIMEQISLELDNIKFYKIDVELDDYTSQFVSKLHISTIPTIVLFKDGIEIDRRVGFSSQPALIKWINDKLQ